MNPQEKANELVEKFLPEVRGADRYSYNLEDMNVFIAKQCALIAVDEILKLTLDDVYDHDFWDAVKSELSKQST